MEAETGQNREYYNNNNNDICGIVSCEFGVMRSIRVCGLQLPLRAATNAFEKSHNIGIACRTIRENPGAQLYLLPELSPVGYTHEVASGQ